jgi:hypothetical protein
MLPQDLPGDLPSFLERFGTDEQCRDFLFRARWPDGFRCAGCGDDRAWAHKARLIDECTACRQATFAARRHELRADQDRVGQVVSRDLPGDREQGRDLRHGA